MTAYRLAQLTDIHETQVGRLKNGKVKGITFDTLEKLCEALNCEPGDLLVRHITKSKHQSSKERTTSKPKAQKGIKVQ